VYFIFNPIQFYFQRILRIRETDEVEENINNTSLNDFKWISTINAQTGENTSLYESMRNVLQESQIHPKGIVYTVFLKFQTEN
jgi:hypothetical protein